MGTQTMGSRGSAGGGGAVSGGSGGTLDSKSHALTRQGSLYSLTLDEVQNQLGDLGKPLSSMNLDELLKSVWSAETTNQISVTGNNSFASASAPSLPRQTSLTLSRDLSKKTVDEVWRDIRQGHNGNNDRDRRINERQPTLGEITLEDFLVKAGVVAESSPGKKFASPTIVADHVLSQQNVPPQQTQWMPYQQNQQHNMMSVYIPGHPMQQAIPIGGNQIVEAVYPESQMSMSPSGLIGALSDTQTPGRKRASGDVVEKTVERRQKRMIKNRESAARSRARKQAYTHELENKVSRLEEENERLKRQKEVEKLLPSPPPEPKYQLRRTSSAGF